MTAQPLPVSAIEDTPPPTGLFGAHIRSLITAMFKPICGLDRADLFSTARDVTFGPLLNEDKVVVRHGLLVVDDNYPQLLARSGRSFTEQLALLSLYVVHEAVHEVQGIGRKSTVTNLRGTGHEDELMHLDLEADHIAVQVVSRVFSTWDHMWLRDVQGLSICDFPTTAGHSPSSRMRKAARVASLRLDSLLRRRRPHLVKGDGYVYAVFGEGAGTFQAFMSGAPTRMVFEGHVDDGDAGSLLAALDGGPCGLREVDRVLERLVARSVPQG